MRTILITIAGLTVGAFAHMAAGWIGIACVLSGMMLAAFTIALFQK